MNLALSRRVQRCRVDMSTSCNFCCGKSVMVMRVNTAAFLDLVLDLGHGIVHSLCDVGRPFPSRVARARHDIV
ncbi:hypothetical protein WK78_22015 [Burkholderia cepacia]|nr:hypothetical protein WK78_22015 [Burkholderia cepacia]